VKAKAATPSRRGFGLPHIAGRNDATLGIGIGFGFDIAIGNDLNPEAHWFLTTSNPDTDSNPDSDADSEELSPWL
jgi:hypothetical protein